MINLNNNQFSSLLENLKRIEKGFTDQEKQFEIINKKIETLNEKVDKQDKSKWINNLIEPFSFAFIYRSISFYFSKNISADSIKNISSYINKEKVKLEISKLLLFWITLTIIREFYAYYQKNKEKEIFKWLNYSLKKNWNKLLIFQLLTRKDWNKEVKVNSLESDLILIN